MGSTCAQIDALADSLIKDGVAIGCVVGTFRAGETQVPGQGKTRKRSSQAPDGRTIYEIGSISTVFTGVLLADMSLRADVKLDDPLQSYMPNSVKVSVTHGRSITLENLATHTSGLPRLPDNLGPMDPANPHVDYTVQKMMTFLLQHDLR